MTGSKSKKFTAPPPVADINVTPLIDVLLVLLIIFMVITPLKPSRFEAKVPAEPKDQQNVNVKPNPLTLVIEINKDQRLKVIQKLRDALGTLEGQTVALLGLAFKPNTDDLREAPALEIAHLLRADGVSLRAYDPVAMPAARRLLPDVYFAADAFDAVAGADAAVVITDWNEFKQLDLARLRAAMQRPVLVDGRNVYEPAAARAAGFLYYPIGRGTAEGVK